MNSRPMMLKGSLAAILVMAGTLGIAQDAPESLLPPGFDDPAPPPAQSPTQNPSARPPAPAQPAPGQPAPSLPGVASPTGPLGVPGGGSLGPLPQVSASDLEKLPTLEQLEEMSPEELDALLGLKPRFDIPPAARRSLKQVGVLDVSENGLPPLSLARQPAPLVRAALGATRGALVSRWGHILLRRVLASRLAAPEGMDPVEFARLRVEVLNSLGEFALARALAQGVDTFRWDKPMVDAGLGSYLGTGDVIGICPALRQQSAKGADAKGKLLRAICNAYAGEETRASAQLDRILEDKKAARIDVLLAQRFAGAAGRGRRAVTIEWDGVERLSPWRFALASAVGEKIPERLLAEAAPYYQRAGALAPMLPPVERARFARRAARDGLMSSRAMVDLYSLIYADSTIEGPGAARAVLLRDAYAASDPAARLAAIEQIWGGGDEIAYGDLVLTAYAAARLPAREQFKDSADPLIASMLAAGLDRDARAWRDTVPAGSEAWAMIALAQPEDEAVSGKAIAKFIEDDPSTDQRKSRFLLAALAGLGRIERDDLGSAASKLDLNLGRTSRWTKAISSAAAYKNQALVALLAGLGMQGDSWDRMTPLYLYHIIAALDRAGLKPEARMIAAEAIARG